MPRDPHDPPQHGYADRDDSESTTYELDLDDGPADAESAIRDAVAAVEARTGNGERGSEPEGPDDADELVRRLQEEVEDLRDRSIRTLADFENYRRRVERERSEQRRYAAAEALTQFLDVMDNLERALASAAEGEDLRRGLEMIHRQMGDLLGRLGATPVPAVGERFDPAWHEAVASVPDRGVEAPTVIEEYQRGYRLFDRLLRPARVRVALPPERTPSHGGQTGTAGPS